MKKLSLIAIVFSLTFAQDLFFSEYSEGSSNNKYLEIYNPTDGTVDLSGYMLANVSNAPSVVGEHEYTMAFTDGATIDSGDVYVVCHGSSSDEIMAECDQTHNYLSNGDDGYALMAGDMYIDWVGDFNGDPGSAWDVCDGGSTKDNTLVRKASVTSGSEWSVSSNSETCEWDAYEQNTWDYLGYHETGDDEICEDANVDWAGDQNGDGYLGFDESTVYVSVESYPNLGTATLTVNGEEQAMNYENWGDNAHWYYGFETTASTSYEWTATVSNGCGTSQSVSDSFTTDCNNVVGGNAEVDSCGVCEGDGTSCSVANLFFSEAAEGSSNNKYLEIYNASDATVSLDDCSLIFISPDSVLLIGRFATKAVILSSVSRLTAPPSRSISTYLATTLSISSLI